MNELSNYEGGERFYCNLCKKGFIITKTNQVIEIE